MLFLVFLVGNDVPHGIGPLNYDFAMALAMASGTALWAALIAVGLTSISWRQRVLKENVQRADADVFR